MSSANTNRSRKGCIHTATPPPWRVSDWMELLPPKDAPDTEESERRLHLWKLYRRVLDWACAHDVRNDPHVGEREPREYRRASAPPQSVDYHMEVLGALGTGADRQQLVSAGLGIASWGEAVGMPLAALRFAEAAAACDPFDPAPANVAGRLSRALGMGSRADLWYSRAAGLARARRWTACYVRAHIGHGTLFKDLGKTERASKFFSRASWLAQKAGTKWLAGEVIHDTLLLAISRRAFLEAEGYAARALSIYPRHHDRIPALVHDIALLCTRQAAFNLALPLLSRVVEVIPKPQEKLIVYSTLAYAAAGAGETECLSEATAAVLEMVTDYPACGPVTMVNLAFAARVRREWGQVEEYAKRALSLAGSNAINSEAVRYAHDLLQDAALRAPAAQESELLASRRARGADALRALHESCIRLVTRWHGRTWRERRSQVAAGAFGAA